MMRHLLVWPIFALTIALSTSNAAKEPSRFIIGVQDFVDYQPYSKMIQGDYQGFNRELLDLFAATKGYQFNYAPRPLKRLYQEFLVGKFDLKYPDNPYWSAQLKKQSGLNIHYSQPVVHYVDGLLVRPEQVGRSIKSLRRIGVVSGYTPRGYEESSQKHTLSIQRVDDINRLLDLVLRGRLDGGYGNIAVNRHYLQAMGYPLNELLFDHTLPHTRSSRFLSSIKHPKLIAEFDRFLITHQEKIKMLKQRYQLDD